MKIDLIQIQLALDVKFIFQYMESTLISSFLSNNSQTVLILIICTCTSYVRPILLHINTPFIQISSPIFVF